MVATEGLLLLHVPLPPMVLYNTVLLPAQNVDVPVMSSGNALTNTCFVAYAVPIEYVIVADPPVIPEISPEEASTVATDVLLLDHVPPTDALKKVVVPPAHVVAVPVIVAGDPFTVITPVDMQPAGET
jgi:hypothetical protein